MLPTLWSWKIVWTKSYGLKDEPQEKQEECESLSECV